MKKVTKAVIPAAGFGTRFLPQTKAMPKQMMPIVDIPIIQKVVQELVDAGITDIILVTGYHVRSIEDHFDTPHQDLIENLKLGGPKKAHYIDMVNEIANMANFYYVRQKGPYGNGTPLLNVRNMVDDEPFIYKWSDDFIETNGSPSMAKQLIDTYEKHGGSVLASVEAKRDEDYSRYGFAAGEEIEPGVIDVNKVIEKPGKENAPSKYASVSGFLFTPRVFDYIDEALSLRKEGNELYYIDMVDLMIKYGQKVYAKMIEGGEFIDTGNKLEYLKAQLKYGVKDPDIGPDFEKYLKTFVKGLN